MVSFAGSKGGISMDIKRQSMMKRRDASQEPSPDIEQMLEDALESIKKEPIYVQEHSIEGFGAYLSLQGDAFSYLERRKYTSQESINALDRSGAVPISAQEFLTFANRLRQTSFSSWVNLREGYLLVPFKGDLKPSSYSQAIFVRDFLAYSSFSEDGEVVFDRGKTAELIGHMRKDLTRPIEERDVMAMATYGESEIRDLHDFIRGQKFARWLFGDQGKRFCDMVYRENRWYRVECKPTLESNIATIRLDPKDGEKYSLWNSQEWRSQGLDPYGKFHQLSLGGGYNHRFRIVSRLNHEFSHGFIPWKNE